MPLRILWADDDNIKAAQDAAGDKGHFVDVAYFLSEADELLKKNDYDLIILDMIMSIEPEDTDIGYTADETAKGYEAGLAFYRHNREKIEEMKADTLVYSITGNEVETQKKFMELGLSKDNILDKINTANVNDMVYHIDRVERERQRRQVK